MHAKGEQLNPILHANMMTHVMPNSEHPSLDTSHRHVSTSIEMNLCRSYDEPRKFENEPGVTMQ
jgi:hypothetical protein